MTWPRASCEKQLCVNWKPLWLCNNLALDERLTRIEHSRSGRCSKRDSRSWVRKRTSHHFSIIGFEVLNVKITKLHKNADFTCLFYSRLNHSNHRKDDDFKTSSLYQTQKVYFEWWNYFFEVKQAMLWFKSYEPLNAKWFGSFRWRVLMVKYKSWLILSRKLCRMTRV